jgi:hypothetical protein
VPKCTPAPIATAQSASGTTTSSARAAFGAKPEAAIAPRCMANAVRMAMAG